MKKAMTFVTGLIVGIGIGLTVGCLNSEKPVPRTYHDDLWVHDGWCTLMCFDGRCKCHDTCGPLCSTWRDNVKDGLIPIDNGLFEGEWLIAEDMIEVMEANLESRRIARLSDEERIEHYRKESEERRKKIGFCSLAESIKEEERLHSNRCERVKRYYSELIEKRKKGKVSDR